MRREGVTSNVERRTPNAEFRVGDGA